MGCCAARQSAGGSSAQAGTIFKLSLDGGGFGVVWDFSEKRGTMPQAGRVVGPGGMLYRTTAGGGTGHAGTRFGFDPHENCCHVLYSFGTGLAGGEEPDANLTVGQNGTLYGTTPPDGNSLPGTIFRLDPPSFRGVLRHLAATF